MHHLLHDRGGSAQVGQGACEVEPMLGASGTAGSSMDHGTSLWERGSRSKRVMQKFHDAATATLSPERGNSVPNGAFDSRRTSPNSRSQQH